jgi:phosphoserine phosphatase RsbU/P
LGMLDVILNLIAQVSLAIAVMYFFSRTRFFREIVNREFTGANRALLIVVLGLVSIYCTYSEVTLDSGAVVSLRDLGPIAAGLLGGPLTGLGTGLVGGIYRLYEGGFAAVPDAVSTVLIGFAAGVVYKLLKEKTATIPGAMIFAVAAECFLMLLTLLMARPFSEAVNTVKSDAVPMIVANALSAGLLMAVVRNLVRDNHGEVAEFRAKY